MGIRLVIREGKAFLAWKQQEQRLQGMARGWGGECLEAGLCPYWMQLDRRLWAPLRARPSPDRRSPELSANQLPRPHPTLPGLCRWIQCIARLGGQGLDVISGGHDGDRLAPGEAGLREASVDGWRRIAGPMKSMTKGLGRR